MDNDDRLIGKVLSRREVMRLLAAGGVAGVGGWSATLVGRTMGQAGVASPACVVRPEAVEGPFFVDQQLNRSDVRSDPTTGLVSGGMLLALALDLVQVSTGKCVPLPGAIVDVWQCDARGIYSGVSGPGQPDQAPGGKALRGYQTTDAQGRARFTTIYPGWYQGRTVHLHLKVRTTAAPTGAYEFTSQLYFDDALTDQVLATGPYAGRGPRDTTNRTDGIYRQGGAQMQLSPVKQGEGLAATFVVGVDLSDAMVGRPDGGGGRGRGRGRGN